MPLIGWWRHFQLWLRQVWLIEEINPKLAILDQAVEKLVQRQDAARIEVQALNGQIQQQIDVLKDHFDRRIGRITPQVRKSAAASEAQAVSVVTEELELDKFYADFKDAFGSKRSDSKTRFRPYVDRLRAVSAGKVDRPVLDVGCGRGEWLEFLRDEGLIGLGIDSNAIMIERCQETGLDVQHTELLTYLKNCPDSSLGAITAFDIVDYLPLSALITFLDHARRVLAPGGLLLLESLSPQATQGTSKVFNDLIQRHSILPEVLQFMVAHRGLVGIEILSLGPLANGLVQAETGDDTLLDRASSGPKYYAVLAHCRMEVTCSG